MLDQIKTFNTDRGDIEDLVAMYAFGRTVQEQFEAMDVEAPEWLSVKLRAIKRAVAEKNADRIEKRLTEARLRLDNLKTPQERKGQLVAEIKRLEALRDVQ